MCRDVRDSRRFALGLGGLVSIAEAVCIRCCPPILAYDVNRTAEALNVGWVCILYMCLGQGGAPLGVTMFYVPWVRFFVAFVRIGGCLW